MNKKTLIIVLSCVLAAAVVCAILISVVPGGAGNTDTQPTGNSAQNEEGTQDTTGGEGGAMDPVVGDENDIVVNIVDPTTGTGSASGDNTGSTSGDNTGSKEPSIGIEIEDPTQSTTGAASGDSGSSSGNVENSAVIDFDDLLEKKNGQ